MRDSGKDQQQMAPDPLKTLYGISKLLSTFNSIDITFPKILDLTSESFPLHTVVLVEHLTKKPKTVVWHSKEATDEQIKSATVQARNSYSYMMGSSISESEDLQTATASSSDRVIKSQKLSSKSKKIDNYIALPLLIDSLPPLGAIQFEGSSKLKELDLEFISALADLISVALDRYYKTIKERRLRVEEAEESTATITRSNEKIFYLENERALRESFVSLLTHDLRTPLSAVLMASQLIIRKAEDPEACRILATRISTNVNRAGQMITDLLDANLIRSGEKLQLKFELTDLTNLVKDTLDVLMTIHGDKFIFKKTEPIEGFWDAKSLRRILENLCNNAIKYGFANTPILVSIEKTEKGVHLIVHNEGDAIKAEDQQSLFKQFRRTENAQSGNKKGWGIGLTLVLGVAEAHGGSVKVESEANRGTTFTVILPIDSRRDS
ncbi:MAG TPA: HAMP domain-containing sensor histidine kinase [Bacteriovoracaceae bacterium]|nr:HAMP domain-containing sensor histidine kinase [Bacteriovoracaceae bacterium]